MSNLDEPMISADYESRERSIAYDAKPLAADGEGMKAALKEYIIRLMFEKGPAHGLISARTVVSLCEIDALIEYEGAKLIKEGNCV